MEVLKVKDTNESIFDSKIIAQIILEMASSNGIIDEVKKNYADNTWWPLHISDYRKRMIIAGLSSRVSYNMINTYNKVCFDINEFSFEAITKMNDSELNDLLKPLGLVNSRVKYVASMSEFLILNTKQDIFETEVDTVIENIAKNVYGASYKIAQCALLYAKSYYCGIFPIDSGMKDVLFPCLHFKKYKTSIGHEHLRKEITTIILEEKSYLISEIKTNYPYFYNNINENGDDGLIWWAHLTMIYYKRKYCNKKAGNNCPLAKNNYCINKTCLQSKE